MEDITKVRRPADWPFSLTSESSEAVEELIDGIKRQDLTNFDLFLEDCHAAFRSQEPDDEKSLQDYYLAGGWKSDAIFD